MSEQRQVPVERIDAMARKLAVLCNGGQWETHYTDAQRDLWLKRARRILEGRDPCSTDAD